jgi:hypothetical protein
VALNKKFAAIAGGVTAIGATVALTAGTFSYFSDSQSLDGNTVQFGTLKLSPGHGQFKDIHVTDATPGTVVYNGTDEDGQDPALCFQNTGSMWGVLQLKVVPDAGDWQAFKDNVRVEFVGYDTYPESTILHGANTLQQYQNAPLANASRLAPQGDPNGEDYKCAQMIVSVDKAAPNSLQGVGGGFSIQAELVQMEDAAVGNYPAS